MRSRWDSLHAEFVRSIHSEKASQVFEAIKASSPDVLGQFDSSIDLIAHLEQGSVASFDEKDAILAALVRGAAEPAVGGLALEILVLTFWPGLSGVLARLARHFSDDANDLATEIVERFTECVGRLDLDRCERIAATLVMNTERVVRRALVGELRHQQAVVHGDAGAEVMGDPMSERGAALVEMRAWLRRALPDDAELVFSIVVAGRDCREVADALGLTYANARQRLARALARIRRRLQKVAVTRPPISTACGGQ